jgi:hypothetical protein
MQKQYTTEQSKRKPRKKSARYLTPGYYLRMESTAGQGGALFVKGQRIEIYCDYFRLQLVCNPYSQARFFLHTQTGVDVL